MALLKLKTDPFKWGRVECGKGLVSKTKRNALKDWLNVFCHGPIFVVFLVQRYSEEKIYEEIEWHYIVRFVIFNEIYVTGCDTFGGRSPKVGVNHVHFCLFLFHVSKCFIFLSLSCVHVMMIYNYASKIDYMLSCNLDFYYRREFCWQDWWYADPQLWLLLWKRILLIRLIIYMMLVCNFDFYCRREFC